MTLNGLMLVIA